MSFCNTVAVTAKHGFNVTYKGEIYPFTTSTNASVFRINVDAFDRNNLLGRFKTFEAAGFFNGLTPWAPMWSKQNDAQLVDELLKLAAIISAPRTIQFFRYSPFSPPSPAVRVTPSFVADSTAVRDTFKSPAPPDDNDMSTEACWKRQVQTIVELQREIAQKEGTINSLKRDADVLRHQQDDLIKTVQSLREQVTAAEKLANHRGTLVSSLHKTDLRRVEVIDRLRTERNGFRDQVLKNQEAVAVVRKHRETGNFHIIKDGQAADFGKSEVLACNSANQINKGTLRMSQLGLLPYYLKGDYAGN